jgi:hypothetical protein
VGDVRGLRVTGDHVDVDASLGVSVDMLTSFGVDADGEQYALSQGGDVFRLDAA